MQFSWSFLVEKNWWWLILAFFLCKWSIFSIYVYLFLCFILYIIIIIFLNDWFVYVKSDFLCAIESATVGVNTDSECIARWRARSPATPCWRTREDFESAAKYCWSECGMWEAPESWSEKRGTKSMLILILWIVHVILSCTELVSLILLVKDWNLKKYKIIELWQNSHFLS